MSNVELLKMVKNYRVLNSIEKFTLRQGWKPRIYGVHVALFKKEPGVSNAGFYIRNRMNIETVKRIHKEELKCIQILKGKINL